MFTPGTVLPLSLILKKTISFSFYCLLNEPAPSKHGTSFINKNYFLTLTLFEKKRHRKIWKSRWTLTVRDIVRLPSNEVVFELTLSSYVHRRSLSSLNYDDRKSHFSLYIEIDMNYKHRLVLKYLSFFYIE